MRTITTALALLALAAGGLAQDGGTGGSDEAKKWVDAAARYDASGKTLTISGRAALPTGTTLLLSIEFSGEPVHAGQVYVQDRAYERVIATPGGLAAGAYRIRVQFHPGLQLAELQAEVESIPPFQLESTFEVGASGEEAQRRLAEQKFALEARSVLQKQIGDFVTFYLQFTELRIEEDDGSEAGRGPRLVSGGQEDSSGGTGQTGPPSTGGGPFQFQPRERKRPDGDRQSIDGSSYLEWFRGWKSIQDRAEASIREYRQGRVGLYFPKAIDLLERNAFMIREMAKSYSRRLFRHHRLPIPLEFVPPGNQELGLNNPEVLQHTIAGEIQSLYRELGFRTQAQLERVILLEALRTYRALRQELDAYVEGERKRGGPRDPQAWPEWRIDWQLRVRLREMEDIPMAPLFVEFPEAVKDLDAFRSVLRRHERASFHRLHGEAKVPLPGELASLPKEQTDAKAIAQELDRRDRELESRYDLDSVVQLLEKGR